MGKLTGGASKLLIEVGGLSLIERTVRLLAREVERVVVVVGHDHDHVADRARRGAPEQVEVIHAECWEQGNGASLAAAQPAVSGDPLFLVVVGDHLLGEGTLRDLLDAGAPAALVDSNLSEEDLEEATRVVVEDGYAVAFGKDRPSRWADCGAFVLSPAIFDCQRDAAALGDFELAGALSSLAQTSPISAVPVRAPGWWQDVDTPADLRRARERLRRSLAKPADGPVSRWLNRPVSTRVSMLLTPLRLSPDLLSLVVAVLGLLTAALLAGGQQVAGAVLAQATSVLDGVDGELARLQLRAGPRGAMLDGALDRIVDAAIAAGLGVWSLNQGLKPWTAVVLTAAATAASLLSMATKDRAAALGLPSAPERALGFVLGGRDGRLLLVAVLAALGQPALALLAVTLTAGITATARVLFVRRR
jgi:choline kinase/phosphatidylglycerophosphate synthase